MIGCVDVPSIVIDGGSAVSDAAADAASDAGPLIGPRRRLITIFASKVAGDLADFPLLIALPSDTDLAANARDDGNDIQFTVGAVAIPHELELFDGETGQLTAWVRVPNLSATTDTVIYLHYGDNTAALPLEDPAAVWAGYAGVWHLEESAAGTGNAGIYLDSTANAHHARDEVTTAAQQGYIGNGLELSEVAREYAQVDDVVGSWPVENGGLDLDKSDLTISAWIRYVADQESSSSIVRKGAGSPDQAGYWFHYGRGTNQLRLYVSDGMNPRFTASSSAVPAINDQEWHYVSVTMLRTPTSDQIDFYLDGESAGGEISSVIADSSANGDNEFVIGGRSSMNERYWNGALDEIRVSSTPRDLSWVLTEMNNQSDPASFYMVGAPEAIP
jgi:MSHA biogenesis protein MshQ